jgi:hypothetical protein
LGPAVAYAIAQPRAADLAAQTYRTELFGRLRFTAWDGAWYAGHHVPGYSVLFPPLGWLIGPALLAALAAVVAAAAFGMLVERAYGPAALLGSAWFATLGVGSELLAGRLTFQLGLALGLVAAVALQRRRTAVAAGAAAATGLASPVAALFLGLASVADGLGKLLARRLRRALPDALVAAAALSPVVLLYLLFPEGGSEPFYKPFFVTTLGMTIALGLLLPRRSSPALVIGVLLYAAGTIVTYRTSTGVGSNVARLGALAGGPLLACALLSSRSPPRLRVPLAAAVSVYSLWHLPPWFERGALLGGGLMLLGLIRRPDARLWKLGVLAGLLPFAIFQWSQTWIDWRHAISDPATRATYFRPLLGFLDRARGPHDWRVEVPPMREHWESVYVADRYPLARGWERQLDVRDDRLFYRPHLRRRYHAWLEANAVRFVAFPDAPLDFASAREARILRHPPRYLELRWRSPHWRVYEVRPRPSLVVPQGGARIAARALGSRHVQLVALTPGRALVRVRYSRYWRLRGGCVSRRGGYTEIRAPHPGRLTLSFSVTPGRLLSGDKPRCN